MRLPRSFRKRAAASVALRSLNRNTIGFIIIVGHRAGTKAVSAIPSVFQFAYLAIARLQLGSGKGRFRRPSALPPLTGFTSSLSPFTRTTISSPGFSQHGCLRAKSTPAGVPVEIMSPGSSVKTLDKMRSAGKPSAWSVRPVRKPPWETRSEPPPW